ncbi:DgyrCDS2223 [Dimorphilus gyrociliatus]|uniref:DgyrCDS2223 n=1 Tax=Dimorphilus gyrociliatus TaxID=2664684 RepID=A0A7I8V9V1_9ANNE|nr:DgyrCDS2223 [Dimorphilus gyrociliatus]
MSFTCITCRVAFPEPDLQRAHYKTDWHRYNLKRKVAEMPPVTATAFEEKVVSQRNQASEAEKQPDNFVCETCNKRFSSENAFKNHIQSKKHKDLEVRRSENPNDPIFNRQRSTSTSESKSKDIADENMSDDDEEWSDCDDALSANECLFCSKVCDDMEKNMEHMTVVHNFFIPDIDYVSDLEGLLSYLGAKVGEGRMCLWCSEHGKSFRSLRAVQNHMTDKQHCKMLHEGDTLLEYEDYYDYSSSYPENGDNEDPEEIDMNLLDTENAFEITLPSGAVIGHRSLLRYYKQNLKPERQLVLAGQSKIKNVIAQYKALGWTGTTELAFFAQWWSGSDVTLHFENEEDCSSIGHENTLILMNHKYDIDWLMTWIISERIGILPTTKVFVKNSLKYVPIFGWAWVFTESIFLKRSWEKDRKIITRDLQFLHEYPPGYNITLLMFCEGTRFSEKKLEESNKFAAKNNLPQLKHTLLPRTKGFVLTMEGIKDKFDAVWDITIGFRKDGATPTVQSIFDGKPTKAELYCRRIPIKDIPTDSDKEASDWLYKTFAKKVGYFALYFMKKVSTTAKRSEYEDFAPFSNKLKKSN